MKKQLLFALVSIWVSMSAFATNTVTWLPINSNNIGYDSVRVAFKVTATSYGSNNYKEKFLYMATTGDSMWHAADTMITSGTGPTQTLGAHNLRSVTTYKYGIALSSDSFPNDTVISIYTFTTKSAPRFPAINVQEISKLGVSELVVTATITNGTNFPYEISAIYGDIYQYYSDTMFGITTKTDTLHIPTPNANEETPYGIWIHTNAIGDTVLHWDSLVTPRLVGDSVSANYVSSGTDSAAFNANVIRNGDGTSTIKFVVKDSTGSSTIATQTVAVTGTGNYPKTIYNLLDNKLYRFEIYSNDTLGVHLIKSGSFRTKARVPNQPPTAYFVRNTGPTSECDSIELEGYNITRAGTDIGKAFLISAINDSDVVDMHDTLATIVVDRNISKGYFKVHAPELGVRYYYRLVTKSSDNIVWVSSAISAPTASAEQPFFHLDTVGYTTTHPSIQISGNTQCQDLIIYLTTYNNSTGQIWYDTVYVPKKLESFHVVVSQSNLPAGSYSISGNLRSGRWPSVFYSMPGQVVRGNITTGIKQNTLENISFFPNPTNGAITIKGLKEKGNVKVFNSTGQVIFDQLSDEQIDISGNPAGLYFMRITNEDGNSVTEKIRLQ